jgi:hypothetical protein
MTVLPVHAEKSIDEVIRLALSMTEKGSVNPLSVHEEVISAA